MHKESPLLLSAIFGYAALILSANHLIFGTLMAEINWLDWTAYLNKAIFLV